MLLLDAGDANVGTLYYWLSFGKDIAQLMNIIGYDAMTLGK